MISEGSLKTGEMAAENLPLCLYYGSHLDQGFFLSACSTFTWFLLQMDVIPEQYFIVAYFTVSTES